MAIPQINTTPVDDRSEKNIQTLLPGVQILARSLVHAAAANSIDIKVISGTRTYAQQHALYLQGRSPLDVVNAARAKASMDPITEKENQHEVTPCDEGHSNHNFQIAFDIGIFESTNYIAESPLYKAVAILGKQLGLTWGGDWHSFQDEPHYELRPYWAKDLSETAMLDELRQRTDSGKSLFA